MISQADIRPTGEGAKARALCGRSRASGGEGGADAAVTDSGLDSALDMEICQAACATVLSCDAKLDVAACESQCVNELGGSGYLIPEIAKRYFIIRDASTYRCMYALSDYAWHDFALDESDNPIPLEVDNPEILAECLPSMRQIVGSSDEVVLTNECFVKYYRYNTHIRTEVKKCFAIDGTFLEGRTKLVKCIGAQQVYGGPWIAGRSGTQ